MIKTYFLKSLYSLLSLFIPFICFSQVPDFHYPELPKTGKDIYAFIPHGWKMMDSASGNLNRDKLKDIAFVIRSNKVLDADAAIPASGFIPKMLVILFKHSDKSWKLSTAAFKIFDTSGNEGIQGNDPYQDVKAMHDTLSITFGTGGTAEDYTTYYFQFQNNDWYLIGKHEEEVDLQKSMGVYLVNYETINFVTGEDHSARYDEEAKKYKEASKQIPVKSLKTLADFNNKVPGHLFNGADSIDRANTKIIEADGDYIAKATISKKDSIIHVNGHLGPGYKDYRLFGYKRPDTLSKRMILISIFTSDVEGNPFHCPFGAYYGTNALNANREMQLKYLSLAGKFIKAGIMKDHKKLATVYIEKKWIEAEVDYIDPTGAYKWKYVKKTKFSQGYPGYIQVKSLDRHTILLNLYVSKGAPSYNSGSAFDTLTYHHNQAVYRTEFDSSCKITFRFTNKGVYVNEKTDDYNHGCGFGHAVMAGGYFEKISSEEPVFINYSTGNKLDVQP